MRALKPRMNFRFATFGIALLFAACGDRRGVQSESTESSVSVSIGADYGLVFDGANLGASTSPSEEERKRILSYWRGAVIRKMASIGGVEGTKEVLVDATLGAKASWFGWVGEVLSVIYQTVQRPIHLRLRIEGQAGWLRLGDVRRPRSLPEVSSIGASDLVIILGRGAAGESTIRTSPMHRAKTVETQPVSDESIARCVETLISLCPEIERKAGKQYPSPMSGVAVSTGPGTDYLSFTAEEVIPIVAQVMTDRIPCIGTWQVDPFTWGH
jgi:hypothetical protein